MKKLFYCFLGFIFLCLVFIGIEIFMKSSKSQPKKIEGIAVFQGKVSGIVKFTDLGNKVAIDVSIKGLKKNAKHGFHVHEYGDMSEQCTSMCSHFTPLVI